MSSIKKNISYQIAYQFLTILIPLVTSPYIARVLGAKGVGIYSYTYSIASYFVLFAKLGIQTYGNRVIAMVRDDRQKLNQTFSDLLAVHLCVSVVVLFIYSGYILLGKVDHRGIAVIQTLYIFAEMVEINWLYFGLEEFKITVVRNSVVKIVSLAAIFLFVKSPDDVWKYCTIMAVGAVLSEIIVWGFFPRYIKIVRPDWKNAWSQLGPLIGFFIPSVAVSLYKVMDKIMLGAMTDTVQVGYYENSEKIIIAALGFVTAIGNVMMPRMSNLISRGEGRQGEKILAVSMQIVMAVSMALAGGIMGTASTFAPVFWGKEFRDCDIFLRGLALSLLFTAFANVLRTQYLLPHQKDRVFQISVIAGAAVNLIINFLMIPHWKALGAVIGTIIAEGVVCLIQTAYSFKYLPVMDYLRKMIPYLFFTIIMSTVVYLIGIIMEENVRTLVVQILTGVGLYIGFTITYLYVTKNELWNVIIKTKNSQNND